MKRRWMVPLLRVFGLMPRWARDIVIGWTSPAYRVGTVGILIDEEGQVLLVRHSYRPGWALPGGMLGWRESPDASIVREMREEVGVETVLVGKPLPVISSSLRRVIMVYDLVVADGVRAGDACPSSPEITEVRWFDLADLPDVSRTTRMVLEARRDRSG